MATYFRKQALELDRSLAVLFFNQQDITVSSLCWLVRTYPSVKVQARVPLHGRQVWLLRKIGNGLEYFWPGHCVAAREADIARARQMQASLA